LTPLKSQKTEGFCDISKVSDHRDSIGANRIK
jgi:hypothetical protein